MNIEKTKLKDFWKKERERAVWVIERINKKDWDSLPIEYKSEPERAIKHFLVEIKDCDEKIKEYSSL